MSAGRIDGKERRVRYMNNEWATPQDLFVALDAEFHFTLDAAASHDNAKTHKFLTVEDDALGRDWGGQGEVVWLNPPYGNTLAAFVEKAWVESLKGATVVCLVPARTDTGWWHDFAARGEVRFIRGRVRFGGAPSNAPFPSAVVVFRPQAAKLRMVGGVLEARR